MRKQFGSVAVAAGLALAAAFAAGGAQAQEPFPSQPLEVVTHASAGGGTDTTARMSLIRARKELNTDAFVITKPGGGGAVAMSYVKEKAPDGHTLLAITPTHLFTMARGKAPLGIDDIKGVVRTTDDPIIIMVRGDSDIKTLEDLIRVGKERPLKWGGTQIGGVDHIAAISFAKAAGVKLSFVPFDGGGEFLTALMGGDIEVAGFNVTETKDQIDAGDVTPLASMSERRLGALPDTPTLTEKGMDVVFSTVRGYVVPRDVPDEHVKILEAGLLKAMDNPVYQSYLTGSGLDASSVAGSAEWDAQIRKMYKVAAETMKELGLAK